MMRWIMTGRRPGAIPACRGGAAGGRQNHRASAPDGKAGDSLSDPRGVVDFAALGFALRPAGHVDSRRGRLHRRFRVVLRLGRDETVERASVQFAAQKISQQIAQINAERDLKKLTTRAVVSGL